MLLDNVHHTLNNSVLLQEGSLCSSAVNRVESTNKTILLFIGKYICIYTTATEFIPWFNGSRDFNRCDIVWMEEQYEWLGRNKNERKEEKKMRVTNLCWVMNAGRTEVALQILWMWRSVFLNIVEWKLSCCVVCFALCGRLQFATAVDRDLLDVSVHHHYISPITGYFSQYRTMYLLCVNEILFRFGDSKNRPEIFVQPLAPG